MSAVIPVFGIVAIGLVLRKVNWLTEEADQSLLRVNINLLFPCLILDAAMGNAALSRHYGGDPPTAPRAVIGTSATGLITIPLWIRFGLNFVGV